VCDTAASFAHVERAPVATRASQVSVNSRRSPTTGDHHVHVTLVIEIAECKPTTGVSGHVDHSPLKLHFCETPPGFPGKELVGLTVGVLGIQRRLERFHAAVGHEKIEVTVMVKIRHAEPFEICGEDTTPDMLLCEEFPACEDGS